MLYIWILFGFIIFFSYIYYNYLRLDNRLNFLRAILFASVLTIPVFYMSLMAGAPKSWIPGLGFMDWVLPLLWGILIIFGWFRIDNIFKRYSLIILYLLSPASLFLGVYANSLSFTRFLFFILFVVSLVVILMDKSRKHVL